MAFVKTLASQFPTLGSPNFAGPPATTLGAGGNVTSATPQAIGVSVVVGTNTVTFTPISGPGTFTRGWVRVKSTTVGAGGTITWKATLTDGVTTQQVINPIPVTAANTIIDNIFPFMTDLNATSIIISITAAVATSVFDVEVALNT